MIPARTLKRRSLTSTHFADWSGTIGTQTDEYTKFMPLRGFAIPLGYVVQRSTKAINIELITERFDRIVTRLG